MLRRIVAGRPILEPDEQHLHNLVFHAIRLLIANKKLANNLTGLCIVTIFCLFPVILTWARVLGLDDQAWSYIVIVQWLLYAPSWFILRDTLPRAA